MNEDEVDPRAALPCPLGLKQDGREHDPKTIDEWFWQCACGAWQKGTKITFTKGTVSFAKDGDVRRLVSDRHLWKMLDAGLSIDPKTLDGMKRRRHGPS